MSVVQKLLMMMGMMSHTQWERKFCEHVRKSEKSFMIAYIGVYIIAFIYKHRDENYLIDPS